MMKKIFSGELAQGSLILFVMINIYNFLNYLFHFLTARLLGPVEYGVLAVLMSFVYIFAIPSEALQTIVSRYTSSLNIEKEFGKMHFILSKVLQKGLWLAIICFILFSLFSISFSHFLKIDYPLFFITGGVLFGVFLVPPIRGVLQGRKQFKALGSSMVVESVTKIILATLLILGGMGVYGAMSGVFLGIFVAFFLSLLSIKDILKTEKHNTGTKGVYKYSFSVFLMMLVVILIYSLDIIAAKLFFPGEIAGKYAVASMIGKMIYFGTAPISKAMFPITSQRFDEGKKTKVAFLKSFFIILGLAIIPLLVMYFYPALLIQVLFGKAYGDVAPLLFFIGLALTLLSLTNLIFFYGIAINKIRNIYPFLIFIVIEIALFSIFHTTMKEFSLSFLTSNIIIFLITLIYILKK